MVSAIPNPALDAFVGEIAPELVFGQVLVRRTSGGFELTHVEDRGILSLHDVTATELRELAQFTATDQFRPLKSAPTLQRGWRFVARNGSELDAVLQCLYPGAVADWFAVRRPSPPVTHYRSFTSRQTGMYRITAKLSDAKVAMVARAGCHGRFCLKQRLWTVEGLAPDAAAAKSLIPCLEPCAVLLEFARTAACIEQREKPDMALTAQEVETLAAALERTLESSSLSLREADFSQAENPRRLQLLLEKLKPVLRTENTHEHS